MVRNENAFLWKHGIKYARKCLLSIEVYQTKLLGQGFKDYNRF